MKALVLSVTATIFAAHALGAERWTLDDVVSDALRNHPLLVASRERLAAAEGTSVDAGRWPNPSLTFSGENLRPGADDFDLGIDPDWFLFVTQTIETADKRGHRKRAAEAGVDLAAFEHEVVERELVHRVKRAFQTALTAQQKLTLARDSWRRVDELAELNRVRAVEGYAPEGDYIKSRLEAQRFEHEVRQSDLAFQQAKIRLLQTLGETEFATDFELAPPEPVSSASIDEGALRDAVASRPEIRAAEAVVARADALAHLEAARANPNVVASVGYKRNGPANTLYLGMSLPLPILNRNQGAILRGRAELAAAEAELTLQRSQVLAELEAALEGVRMTRQQVESLRTDFIDRADESRAVALAAYSEGAADLLIVLEAERTRNAAQELVVDAVHDFRLAVFELERAAGVDTLPRTASIVGEAP